MKKKTKNFLESLTYVLIIFGTALVIYYGRFYFEKSIRKEAIIEAMEFMNKKCEC